MKISKMFRLAVVMSLGGYVCLFGTQAFAGQVSGKLKWASGTTAEEMDLEVMYESHNSQSVRSDSGGNFTISWAGNVETATIFFKGNQVYKGLVKDGDRITVTIK